MSDGTVGRLIYGTAFLTCLLCSVAISATPVAAAPPCIVPDNGGGTVTLPPAGCDYLSPQDVHEIIDGLPPGTTIELTGIHREFVCRGAASPPAACSFFPSPDCDQPGGQLGGEQECADSTLQLTLHGTGTLAGWDRVITLPVSFETHTAPRTPGAPVQSFDTDMFRLGGLLPAGDPDFDLLRIRAGTAFGMPSPGHTTLVKQGPNWAVDSFFDITYTIDFIGRPGGQIGGMSGSTTATIRMQTGDGIPCDPPDCDDGQICTVDACDSATGQCTHSPLNCDDGNPCTQDGCIQAFVLTPPCVVPDNGGGTVTLPPAGCDYLSPDDVHEIAAGLPPGTTIELSGIHRDFACGSTGQVPAACSFVPSPECDQPGGSLGGEKECSDSSLQMNLHGTGMLAGWDRVLTVPVSFETHTAPRTPGAPFQSFDTEMFRLQGQLPAGDPDFDLLHVSAGTHFGLPSPGHTTLRQVGGGNWAVDSFFDITYRIDFIGRPGGQIGGMSGSTTATIRMQTGSGVGCVYSPVSCDDGNPCTDDSCNPDSGCVNTPSNCDDGQICTVDACDPQIGCTHAPLSCDDGNACTVDGCMQALVLTPPCVVPDNGGGTVTLPPAGCDYLSPQDVHEIIDGLPPGTTIQLGAIHRDFICHVPGQGAVCSFQTLADCDEPGGSLGGEKECSDSSLQMTLTGTGMLAGWNRTVQLPISFETHTAPRTPGAPVQSFDTDMFRLFGQIANIGDPDFDLLRIVAGTDFGLPSPGHTTLRQIGGGNWSVDSFFDITYRIDFVGAPGGRIGGMSGSTTGTIRMQTGSGVGCTHTPTDCDDSNACTDDSCDAVKGCIHAATNCDDSDPCTNDSCVQAFASNPCTAVNTGGTVVLPPPGCAYLSPSEVHEILNGLMPPGATIEFAAIHRDFICHPRGTATPPEACDPVFANVCRTGTPETGVDDCSDSIVELHLHGTGGIPIPDRTILMPLTFQTHQGPRTPGQPVQSFPADMSRMYGQITGDPDFDLLRITAGTLNGLPSPGHTTLTQLGGGNFKVDSFFDITYRIDFVGSPGGHLGGMSGSTTGTIRMATGTGVGCVHTPNPPPGEVPSLKASKSGGNIIVIWPASAPTYDVVRGRLLAALPVGPGGGDEVCLANDIAALSLTDSFVPPTGGAQGVWYLVRGGNACGSGPYGNQGLHGVPSTPRVTTTCP